MVRRMQPVTLDHLNACPATEFVRLAGPLYERSPWVAWEVVGKRPFASRAALHKALSAAVRAACMERQLTLIRAHPDLVGRTVLTAESQNEQAAAGLTDLTAKEAAAFRRYNADYRARFGFPFVICARKNKKAAILRAFPKRLPNSREAEIAEALAQIDQIAGLRLRDLLTPII